MPTPDFAYGVECDEQALSLARGKVGCQIIVSFHT